MRACKVPVFYPDEPIPPVVPTSLPSALLGSLTAANNFTSTAGQGGDFPILSYKVITFEVFDDVWPARQDLWGFQSSATTGWLLSVSLSTLSFVVRGAGGGAFSVSTNLLVGTHTVVVYRASATQYRAFMDGSTTPIVSGSLGYNAAGASGIQYIGCNSVEANAGPCTALNIINVAEVNATLTDAAGIAPS